MTKRVEGHAGEHIDNFCLRVTNAAKLLGVPVDVEFNTKKFTVSPSDTKQEAIAKYWSTPFPREEDWYWVKVYSTSKWQLARWCPSKNSEYPWWFPLSDTRTSNDMYQVERCSPSDQRSSYER